MLLSLCLKVWIASNRQQLPAYLGQEVVRNYIQDKCQFSLYRLSNFLLSCLLHKAAGCVPKEVAHIKQIV